MVSAPKPLAVVLRELRPKRTSLLLPVPPAAGMLYESGRPKRQTLKYQKWRLAAGLEARLQRFSSHGGPVRVIYEFGELASGELRALTAREQALSEFLESLGVIRAVPRIREFSLRWADDVPEGRVRVIVEDL